MDNLLSLAERVEALTGADREVDAEIDCLLRFKDLRPASPADFGGQAEAYTSSLDAAMTLVRHDTWWKIKAAWPQGRQGCRASLWVNGRMDPVRGEAATPALALVAASLRAIATESAK